MKGSHSEKNVSVLWRFFSSVKLTLALLIILATTSVFGTVIPQQEGAMAFAKRLSPGLVKLLSSFQLFDMYHSLWFRLLIGALALNLIVCSLDRLPTTLKRFRAAPRPDRAKPFENLAPHRQFAVNASMGDVARPVADLLGRHYGDMERKQGPASQWFLVQKARYAHFGVYLVHLSVLLILIGGIFGSIFGFEAYVNIPEGEKASVVRLRSNQAPKALPFSVLCKDFTVDFYENGTPKEYRSDLSFMEDGEVLLEGTLLVNHPITFRGITFYQSSYGTIPGRTVRLRISRDGESLQNSALEVEKGLSVPLPGSAAQFRVAEVEGNLRGMMGPAVLISVVSDRGGETRFWVFQDIDRLRKRFPPAMFQAPILNPSSFKPYTFFLDGIESRYYTGLQVNRDPGVPLVWLGFFLIIAGLFVTFFISHRRVWVRLSESQGRVSVSVAGTANKNPVGLEKELDRLTQKLRQALEDQQRK
jgi:cytochrome c biogenesis protein